MEYKYPVKYYNGSKGPVRGKSVTANQAHDAIRYVMAKFRAWGQCSADYETLTGWDGTGHFGDVPSLAWDYDGHGNASIVWEGNSPYDWPIAITEPFIDQEFGFKVQTPNRKWPRGVFAEPANGCVLTLYRED